MKDISKGKVIGLALSVVGAVVQVATALHDKKQMEETIKDMVDKAIAAKKL